MKIIEMIKRLFRKKHPIGCIKKVNNGKYKKTKSGDWILIKEGE